MTVTTDKATGKKTYYVPDNATVTVTLDKTLIPEGMVFDIWSTGKFSLPLGQDYKAESITFTMNTMEPVMRILPHSTVMPPLKMMGPMCWALPRSLVLPLWAPQCWAIRPILWALNLQAS